MGTETEVMTTEMQTLEHSLSSELGISGAETPAAEVVSLP